MSVLLDPADALQVAIRAKLLTDTFLTAAFSAATPRIWDTVPVDATGKITGLFPYLTMGEGDQVIGQENTCMDLSEVWMQLNAWSRASDFGECRAICGAVRRALRDPLQADGHNVITREFQSVLYRREPDGLTRRGIMTFRFHTGPWA